MVIGDNGSVQRRPLLALRGPWKSDKNKWVPNKEIYPKIKWGTRQEATHVKILKNWMWLARKAESITTCLFIYIFFFCFPVRPKGFTMLVFHSLLAFNGLRKGLESGKYTLISEKPSVAADHHWRVKIMPDDSEKLLLVRNDNLLVVAEG